MAVAPDRRHLRHALLAVGLACGAAFTALAINVSDGAPNGVDRELADVLTATRASAAFRMGEVVSLGGSPVFVVVAAGVLAFLVWSRRHDVRLAALCILAPAMTGLLQLAVKGVVGPQHPVSFNPWYPDRTLAFPSGHAAGAASIATLVVVIALTSTRSRAERTVTIAASTGYVVLVAASRIVIDDHLAMDAIGGLLLGASVTALGATVALRRSRTPDRRALPGIAR